MNQKDNQTVRIIQIVKWLGAKTALLRSKPNLYSYFPKTYQTYLVTDSINSAISSLGAQSLHCGLSNFILMGSRMNASPQFQHRLALPGTIADRCVGM